MKKYVNGHRFNEHHLPGVRVVIDTGDYLSFMQLWYHIPHPSWNPTQNSESVCHVVKNGTPGIIVSRIFKHDYTWFNVMLNDGSFGWTDQPHRLKVVT